MVGEHAADLRRRMLPGSLGGDNGQLVDLEAITPKDDQLQPMASSLDEL